MHGHTNINYTLPNFLNISFDLYKLRQKKKSRNFYLIVARLAKIGAVKNNALERKDMSVRKGKGKAVPLQAWSGPEGSRKLRFPDFVTTAQDGDKVVNLTHRPPLPPGNTPGTHFC